MTSPMSELSLTSIDHSFTVVSQGQPPQLADSLHDRVQAIWDQARSARPELFDGTVLCVGEVKAGAMNCFPIAYRYIYAQDRDAELGARLNLRAAAVSGILRVNGKVFVGERSVQVTQGAGKLELVPSGGLPAGDGLIDYRQQLLTELAEEVQVEARLVSSVEPFVLIEDHLERVVDICCEIVLKDADEKSVLANFKAGEYSTLHCLSPAELRISIIEAPGRWVPTSGLIVEHFFSQDRQTT